MKTRLLIAGFAILILLAGGAIATGSSVSAQDPSLDPYQVAVAQKAGCQAWLTAHPGSGTKQAGRMRDCVTDETAIMTALGAPSPSPSGTPSASPTATPAPSTSPTGNPPPPSPSPSPTSSEGYPTVSNRGVPPGTVLTLDPRCVLGTPGEVIIAAHFTCRLSVSASDVTIVNSQLDRGINNWTPAGGHSFQLVDSTLGLPTGCDPNQNDVFAVGATDFTATRIKIQGFTDGVRLSSMTSMPLAVIDSYIATCHLSGAHTDGVQADGPQPGGVTLTHNTIDIRASQPDWTASVFFPADGALTVSDNVLAGGGRLLQIAGGGPDVFTDNKLVDATWDYAPVYILDCGIVTLWSGNVAVQLGGDGQPGPALRTIPCA